MKSMSCLKALLKVHNKRTRYTTKHFGKSKIFNDVKSTLSKMLEISKEGLRFLSLLFENSLLGSWGRERTLLLWPNLLLQD